MESEVLLAEEGTDGFFVGGGGGEFAVGVFLEDHQG
jgi:hypothetical protein